MTNNVVIKGILVVLTALVLNFYFFSIDLRFMPAVNTKMVLAGFGLFVLACQLARKRNALIDKDTFVLSVCAALVSLAGFVSVVYNDTFDYTYATYLISMWVWLSAAYMAVTWIRWMHGTVSVFIVCNYLIALGVSQCALALGMEFYAPLKQVVYSMLDEGTVAFMTQKDRLMGFGVGLDVAGSRFAAILIMIPFVCMQYRQKAVRYMPLYVLAFFIICVIGNMIGRTTTVGAVLAVLSFIVFSKFYQMDGFHKRLGFWITGLLAVIVPICSVAYNMVPEFHDLLRFGFEGFFSLAEKGEWDVHSNEMLKEGFIFPDNPKTWLIGDGYFGSTDSNPYYTGRRWAGFYGGSDVGYSRFLYYFGLVGLLAFSFFMFKACMVCMRRFDKLKYMFLVLLALNFIYWLKVSTDIFLVFALFLCISKEENDAYVERMELRSSR
ncbi:MAG: hypothetical protein H9802_16515 [Candidatus Phocaeicola faecipullorum]|nr:hypothetical protein [Candidatus Phocaeicola faecipullorum]